MYNPMTKLMAAKGTSIRKRDRGDERPCKTVDSNAYVASNETGETGTEIDGHDDFCGVCKFLELVMIRSTLWS